MAGKSPMAGPGLQSDADYQAQSDHRTMSDAMEIQADPKRFAGVKKHQSKQEKKLAMLKKGLTGGKRFGGRR